MRGPLVTLSLPSSPAPVAAPKRGTCARCGRAKGEHATELDLRCPRGYVSAVAKPATVLPPGLVAIVDTAEPNLDNAHDASDRALARARQPWIWNEATKARELIPVVRASLDAGDYTAAGCHGRILVEYKTPADLAATLFGSHRNAAGEKLPNFPRFCAVLSLMASTAKRAAIVVPCSPQAILDRRYETEVGPLSVLGRCGRIFLDYGIPTIWAGSEGEAAREIGHLLKSAWEDERAERKARAAEEARAK